MQRKLISFDIFENIEKQSLSNAYVELCEATEAMSKALDVDIVRVRCFDSQSVVYEVSDGTFLKATYVLNEEHVIFNNIEELVINEASETEARKSVIREMVSSLADGEMEKAELSWDSLSLMLERCMKMGRKKKSPVDMYADNAKRMHEAKLFVRHGPKDAKRVLAARKAWGKRRHKEGAVRAKMHRNLDVYRANRKRLGSLGKKAKDLKASGVAARAYYTRTPKAKVMEWSNIINSVINYTEQSRLIEYKVNYNESGDVANIIVPTVKARNEGKVIQIKSDTVKNDVKVLRELAHKLASSQEFIKSVAELKRHNNISDNDSLEECLGHISANWPEVIALTQSELSACISEVLKVAGEVNYDDETCNFMAEGILRTVMTDHTDKVEKILRLAGEKTEATDEYADFQTRVQDLFSTVDASLAEEFKLTNELYNILAEIANAANSINDLETQSDVILFLDELEPILEGKANINSNLIEEATEWLINFVETNLETSNWVVDDEDVDTTFAGDSPKVAKNALHQYSPNADFDPHHEPLQVSDDSMKLKQGNDGRMHGLGNKGGNETWPTVTNPFLPKSGDFKIKGEKDIESDDSFGTEQSNDTWPNLQNSYLPKWLKPMRAK